MPEILHSKADICVKARERDLILKKNPTRGSELKSIHLPLKGKEL